MKFSFQCFVVMRITDYAVKRLVVERPDGSSNQGQQKPLLVFAKQSLNKAGSTNCSIQYQFSNEDHVSLETCL